MNRILLFPILTLVTASVWAHHYDGNPDLEQGVLNAHSPGVMASTVTPGINDEYGSVLLNMDHMGGMDDMEINRLPPTAAGKMRENEGVNDEYGSVLLDL